MTRKTRPYFMRYVDHCAKCKKPCTEFYPGDRCLECNNKRLAGNERFMKDFAKVYTPISK